MIEANYDKAQIKLVGDGATILTEFAEITGALCSVLDREDVIKNFIFGINRDALQKMDHETRMKEMDKIGKMVEEMEVKE